MIGPKLSDRCLITLLMLLHICFIEHCESIYVQTAAAVTSNRQSPHHHHQHQTKSNSISEKKSLLPLPAFKDDAEISRYVKLHGVESLVWRCKNAIQPVWSQFKLLPFIDLYCEVIGTMKSITWLHNNKEIITTAGDNSIETSALKYSHSIQPHYLDRYGYFSRWIDFTLTIHNVTQKDAGLYAFHVTSPSGSVQQQRIYIDLPASDIVGPRYHKRQRRGKHQEDDKKQMRKKRRQKQRLADFINSGN